MLGRGGLALLDGSTRKGQRLTFRQLRQSLVLGLDVYKRQMVQGFQGVCDLGGGLLLLKGRDNALSLAIGVAAQPQHMVDVSPVSYTHLDVYKRQLLDRETLTAAVLHLGNALGDLVDLLLKEMCIRDRLLPLGYILQVSIINPPRFMYPSGELVQVIAASAQQGYQFLQLRQVQPRSVMSVYLRNRFMRRLFF